MPIANMDSTAADGVLLKATLLSAASVTSPDIGVTGAIINEVDSSFTDEGLNPNTGADLCRVSFSNLDPDDRLAYEGQIVMDVSTNDCAQPDTGAIVTLTEGQDLATAAYFWMMTSSAVVDRGSSFRSSDDKLKTELFNTDTLLDANFLTNGKGAYTTLCWWWRGSVWGLLADGGEIYTGTRQEPHPADSFYKISIGANRAGNLSTIVGRFKNLIISHVSPRLADYKDKTISILGDSFADQLTLAANVSFFRDSNAQASIGRYLSKIGQKARIYADATGSASICDTGADDLSDSFETWAINCSGIVWLIAFNNDSTAGTTDRNNATTGTEANAQKLMTLLGGELAVTDGSLYNNVTKVIICTAGSLTNNAAIDTTDNQTGKDETQAIVNSLPAWWDAAYPAKAGFIEIYDLFTALGGDSETNVNYQGYLDTLGNVNQAPVTPQANRHPSSFGRIKLAGDLIKLTS